MSRYEAPEIGAMIERMLKALARRAGEGEAQAVEQLARLEAVSAEQLGAGVRAHRTGPASASWTEIGKLLGTSRQAAHERFSKIPREALVTYCPGRATRDA